MFEKYWSILRNTVYFAGFIWFTHLATDAAIRVCLLLCDAIINGMSIAELAITSKDVAWCSIYLACNVLFLMFVWHTYNQPEEALDSPPLPLKWANASGVVMVQLWVCYLVLSTVLY